MTLVLALYLMEDMELAPNPEPCLLPLRRYLMEDVELADAARALWEAPFAVLAHDKFLSPEPAFTYANQARSFASFGHISSALLLSGVHLCILWGDLVIASATRRASPHFMAKARSCKCSY